MCDAHTNEQPQGHKDSLLMLLNYKSLFKHEVSNCIILYNIA